MKRILLFVCIQFFLLASFAGETINFCKGWKFHLGDAGKGASSSSYNDSQWRILNIPHDWSIEGTRLVIEKPARPIKAPGKRLDFIREAMKSAAITNEALAQKLNVIRNTVQLWFKKDDITISNIYKIAESYGWEVNITFKLKQNE